MTLAINYFSTQLPKRKGMAVEESKIYILDAVDNCSCTLGNQGSIKPWCVPLLNPKVHC